MPQERKGNAVSGAKHRREAASREAAALREAESALRARAATTEMMKAKDLEDSIMRVVDARLKAFRVLGDEWLQVHGSGANWQLNFVDQRPFSGLFPLGGAGDPSTTSGGGGGSSEGVGLYANPYYLGSTDHGSLRPDGPQANAVVGTPSNARPDTWDILRPPVDLAGRRTTGVHHVLPYRIVQSLSAATTFYTSAYSIADTTVSGALTKLVTATPYLVFERNLTFSSKGKLVLIGPESLLLTLSYVT